MSITNNALASRDAHNSRLQKFFIDQLQDIYWAEQKLVKTLPKLSEAARAGELKIAFNGHLKETRDHVTRLEKIFSIMGEPPHTRKCLAMAGIVNEGEVMIDETTDNTAERDVALIFAGQKTEHYEIATYGGLIQVAKTLGYTEVADILTQTLTEEKEADNKLTQIAENSINAEASEEPLEY